MTKKNVQLETTIKAPAALVGFWDTTVGKTLRAAIYLGVSAMLDYLISATTGTQFGTKTPFINLVLVAAKNLASSSVKNY